MFSRYSIGLPAFFNAGTLQIPDPVIPPIQIPDMSSIALATEQPLRIPEIKIPVPIQPPVFKAPIFLKDYIKTEDLIPSDLNGDFDGEDNYLKESIDILRDAKDWIRDTDFPKEKEKVYLPPVIQPEKTNFVPLAIGAVALFMLFS